MKDVLYSKNFVRQYTKLPAKIQKKLKSGLPYSKKTFTTRSSTPIDCVAKSECLGVLTSLATIAPSFYGRVIQSLSTKSAPTLSCTGSGVFYTRECAILYSNEYTRGIVEWATQSVRRTHGAMGV